MVTHTAKDIKNLELQAVIFIGDSDFGVKK